MAFAHGSNDVANAMGPLSAIYETWNTGVVPVKKTSVQNWVLVLGGVGLVLGLAIFGYKIIRVLGVTAVKLTNSRGFVVEWCTALTVVVASRYGLPVSTTQVVSGAIISMGLWEGKQGVNWRVAIKVFIGWLMTTVIAGAIAALITSIGIYSPNKNASLDIVSGAESINIQTLNQLNFMYDNNLGDTAVLNDLNNTLFEQFKQNVTADLPAVVDLQSETFDLYNTTILSMN